MDNLRNTDQQKIVVFSLEEPGYALYLSEVVKVERAVEITPLPGAPQLVAGVIDVHGEILPVLDIRRLFRLPQRDKRVEDQFIIARTSQRLVVLVVDSVIGVYDLEPHDVMDDKGPFPCTKYLSGIAAIEHGIVLITDLEQFLSLDEQRVLDAALAESEK